MGVGLWVGGWVGGWGGGGGGGSYPALLQMEDLFRWQLLFLHQNIILCVLGPNVSDIEVASKSICFIYVGAKIIKITLNCHSISTYDLVKEEYFGVMMKIKTQDYSQQKLFFYTSILPNNNLENKKASCEETNIFPSQQCKPRPTYVSMLSAQALIVRKQYKVT